MSKTILILAANPKDTSRLRLDQEVRDIENGLRSARRRDDFILKQVWATRPLDIRRAMLEFKPQFVHFCGHGAGEEGIVFEDDIGNSKFVDTDALAGFFELFADKIECVVLNACYSEIQAASISQHINCVVGMNRDIGDAAAIKFAVAFYDALGAGETVEFAYKLACNAIQLAGIPEHSTPILKSKAILANVDSQHPEDFLKPVRVQVTLNGDFSTFSAERRSAMIDALAGLLKVKPQQIEVYRIYEGSIVMELGISSDAANRFRFLLQLNSAQLRLLEIQTVVLETTTGETETWTIAAGIFVLGSHLKAIREAETLLEKEHFGEALNALKDIPSNVAVYERVQSLRAVCFHGRGIQYAKNEQFEAAAADMYQAQALRPDSETLREQLLEIEKMRLDFPHLVAIHEAQELMELEKYYEALNTMESIPGIFRAYQHVQNLRAICEFRIAVQHANSRNLKEAIEHMEKATKYNPTESVIRQQLDALREIEGRGGFEVIERHNRGVQKAQEVLEELNKASARNPLTREQAGKLLAKLREAMRESDDTQITALHDQLAKALADWSR